MILKLFKKSYFAQIALLLGLSLIIWLPAFLKPPHSLHTESGVFIEFLFLKPLFGIPFLSVSMGFILIIFEAFLLSNLFSKHQLTHSNSFLSGFIFVLFLSRTPSHLGFHPALFALLLILFSP